MARYQLTDKAIQDLSDIWNYTYDKWSEKQADFYYDSLLTNCQLVADNPNLGKRYDIIVNGLKGFKSNRHIIFYLMSGDDNIIIARILHGRMDLKSKLNE